MHSCPAKDVAPLAGACIQDMYTQYIFTKWFVTPVYIFTILVGTIGNFLIMYLYSKGSASFRESPFPFIMVHFALANIAQSAIFTPILLAYRINPTRNVIADTPVCATGLFTCMLAITMQFALLPIMAKERNDADAERTEAMGKLTKTKAKVVVYTSWALSFAVGLSYAMLVLTDIWDAPLNKKRDRCIIASQGLDHVTISFFGFSAVEFGLACLGAVYYLFTPIFRLGAKTASEARRTKLVIMLFLLTILLWTPFSVIQVLGIFYYYNETLFNLHGCSSALGMVITAISPILIILKDSGFEEECKTLWTSVAPPNAVADSGKEIKEG